MKVVERSERIRGETYMLKGEPRVWLGHRWGCKCGKQPCFNLEGKSPMYCNDCKKPDMVDVKSKKCHCDKRASFNLPGLKPEYCSLCKTMDMVDVANKKCKCGKSQPHYNIPGFKPMYCSKCRLPDMINVVSKKCNCGKQSNFNYPGKRPIYCSDCKQIDMLDVRSKRCTCGKIASFNLEGKSPLYCVKCRSIDMIDVKHKKCLHNDTIPGVCDQRANRKYKGYCAYCFSHLFPNDPLTVQITKKTYEIKVRDFINSKFQGFIHDKPLWTGNCDCSHRRRIDHRRLITNTLLCIETDENKHSGYDNQDELDRYDDLMMVFSGKWIFIRFNPNTSFLDGGTRRNPTLESRLPELGEEIQKQIERIQNRENDKVLEIVKLFY